MKKEMINGRIVVCENDEYSAYEKKSEVKKLGGIGLVFIDDKLRIFTTSYGTFPITAVSAKDAIQILQYINSTRYLPTYVCVCVYINIYVCVIIIVITNLQQPFGDNLANSDSDRL